MPGRRRRAREPAGRGGALGIGGRDCGGQEVPWFQEVK